MHIAIIHPQIHTGKFLPGAKLPTEAELSRLYGTSKITVRRALQELASQNLIIGHQGKGTFVNASEVARAINVLFIHSNESDISYPYTSLILNGLNKFSQNSSPHLRIELQGMPAPEHQSPDDTRIEELVQYGQCSGVITMPRIRPEAMARLIQKGIPVVMIGGAHYLKTPQEVVLVGTNLPTTKDVVFQHFKKDNRKKIGVITGNLFGGSFLYNSIQETTRRLEIPFNPNQFEVTEWGANGGAQAMQRLLERVPDLDAVFAADDLLALGALQTLWKRGISVPNQIAIIGSGNQLGEHSHSGLSTLDILLREQGRLAGECLLRRISGLPVRRENFIDPLLIHRETT